MLTCSQRGKEVNPKFLHLTAFYSYEDIKHNFELYMWTSTDFIYIIFYYRYWNLWGVNAKNYVNETCLCVANDLKCTHMCLCPNCWNCEEVLYKEEGEIYFNSNEEDYETEWAVVQIDVLIHFKYIFSYGTRLKFLNLIKLEAFWHFFS